jgi:malonyl-CoA O-methyltransferase
MEIEHRAVLDLLPPVAGRRVLDLACGSGRYLRVLAELGASKAIGCDASPEMLRRTRDSGRPVVQGDLRRLPFVDAAFDVVVCGLAVGDVADLPTVVAEMARVLAPAGVAVWSDLHPAGAASGWKRTFRARDGRLYAVRHHVHRVDDHVAACGAAGLVVDRMVEPVVDFDHPLRGSPAALVVRATKPATLA